MKDEKENRAEKGKLNTCIDKTAAELVTRVVEEQRVRCDQAVLLPCRGGRGGRGEGRGVSHRLWLALATDCTVCVSASRAGGTGKVTGAAAFTFAGAEQICQQDPGSPEKRFMMGQVYCLPLLGPSLPACPVRAGPSSAPVDRQRQQQAALRSGPPPVPHNKVFTGG